MSNAQTGQNLLSFLNTPVAMTALESSKSSVDTAMKSTLYVGAAVVISFGLNRVLSDVLDLITKSYATLTAKLEYDNKKPPPTT